MEKKYIKITEYCNHTKVEHTFISTLKKEGILTIEVINDEDCIKEEELDNLEMFSRWYYDLGINVEGIDAMRHMLAKIHRLNKEMDTLRRQLYNNNER